MINFDSELLLGYNVFKERGLCNGKNLRNKRNNDLFAQYVRACNSCTSEEEQQKRYKEVCTCNHVFALYQPTKYYGALHSSDCYAKDAIIECVHCGLTNKFISFEEELTTPWYIGGRGFFS